VIGSVMWVGSKKREKLAMNFDEFNGAVKNFGKTTKRQCQATATSLQAKGKLIKKMATKGWTWASTKRMDVEGEAQWDVYFTRLRKKSWIIPIIFLIIVIAYVGFNVWNVAF